MLVVLNKEKKDKIKLIEDINISELKLLINSYGKLNKLNIQKYIAEEEKKIAEGMEIESIHEEISKWRSQGKLNFREVKDYSIVCRIYDNTESIQKTEAEECSDRNHSMCGFIALKSKQEESYNFGRYGDTNKTHLIEDPILKEIAENVDKTIKDNAMVVNKVTATVIRNRKFNKFHEDMIKAIRTNFKDLAKVYCKIAEDDKESSSEQIANSLVKGILNEV